VLLNRRRAKKQKGQKVILREKQLADAAIDYVWETDSELMDLDAAEATKVSFSEFLVYYAEVINHQSKRNRRFAIETLDGKYIGNCGYYNVDNLQKETEIGIMIGDREYWGKGYGSDAVATLVRYIFQEVGLERIRLYTLTTNVRAQRCFEKCGFVSSGRVAKNGFEFIVMELYRGCRK
jgi:RimJ/RimL family protein N-acetyltransferase